MTYDLIIIGGGPAGSAAAVYASRKRLNTLFVTTEFGGQSVVSEKIFNWIGTVSISGTELAENLKKHVLANADETMKVLEGSSIVSVVKNGNTFNIKTETGEEFETKTILIATGSSRRKLPAKNADKFGNKGLTYCASCDGPLFADMDVAVIGGGNAGFDSVAQLLAYCKSVTLLSHGNSLKADEITVEKVSKNPKMTVIKNADILEVLGENMVEGLIYKDKDGKENKLAVSGIFVEIGQIPNTAFLKDILVLDKIGRIEIDPWTGKTKVPGIWAAGDCTNILYHQNNIAAGDAVRALEDIYLAIKAT